MPPPIRPTLPKIAIIRRIPPLPYGVREEWGPSRRRLMTLPLPPPALGGHPRYAQEAVNYSTAEAKTGLRWANGKNIFRKTIYISALPNSTSGTTAHGILRLNNIVKISGVATSGSSYLMIPYTDTAAMGTQIEVFVDATNITIVTGTDRSGDSAEVTLEYTKT